jgi:CHAT domain-containing protein
MLRARGQRWAPLPGSLAEVEGVAALFGADAVVLKDDQASEGAFRALAADGGLRRFQRLLFSTHGYLSPDEPSLSAIVLSQDAPTPGADGYLTAAELAGFDLASDVVVLSACETGRGRIVEGEGVIGLPYALFVAGNRDTVLSLWPVADESTARLMQRYFERLADGDDPVAALADSKRELRRAERKRWAAPMHWAPFVLYGDGSPARR